MLPTVLLADPAVRLAGARAPSHRRRLAVDVRQPRPRFRWVRLLVGVVLAAVVVGLVYLHTWPPLATVMSGSMAPTIDAGDMVLLKRLDRPARAGDIVSVSVPDEARSRFGYPPVVIHRIVGITADGNVTTKGDAHARPDPFTVPSATLTTKVVATVPAAGRVVAFLGSTLGLLWLVGGGALLLGMPFVDRHRDAQRRDQDERETLESALAAVTAELSRTREARDREAEESREQLRLVTTTFTQHLEQLPAQIERAIAEAFAAVAPPPPPPPPPPAPAPAPDLFARRFVAASRFVPAPTPDLMAALQPPKSPPSWDAPPSGATLEEMLVA
jgi:signal peptidase I